MRDGKASIGVALRDPVPWPELRDIVESAEETGYAAVFVPEIVWREAFSTLAALTSVTTSALLGTGVVAMTHRDEFTTALAAATLHDLSDGRFVLGLGAGEERRLAHVRSYVEDVSRLLRGEAAGGRALGAAPEPKATPIWLAALGPSMVELAGEVANGALLNWCTPERVARAREEVTRGAERAGRDPAAVTIAVYVRTCLGQEEAHALAVLRAAAGEYATMPRYRRQLESMGLVEEAAAAAAAFGSGDPSGVPRRLVDELCLWGDRDAALRRLHAYHDAGADLVVVYPVPVRDRVSSILGSLMALAPAPAVER